MGMRMPETCWAASKRQVINLRSCCILLVDSVEKMIILKIQVIWDVTLYHSGPALDSAHQNSLACVQLGAMDLGRYTHDVDRHPRYSAFLMTKTDVTLKMLMYSMFNHLIQLLAQESYTEFCSWSFKASYCMQNIGNYSSYNAASHFMWLDSSAKPPREPNLTNFISYTTFSTILENP